MVDADATIDGGQQSRLRWPALSYNSSNDTFTLIDMQGDQIVFNGFGTSRPAAQRGEFAYDPVRGHGLLVDFKTGTLWACEPDRTAWAKLQPEGGTMPGSTKRLAYFDLAHNVFVVIHGTTVWADRYKAP